MRNGPKIIGACVVALGALAAALDAKAITTLIGAHVAPDARALAGAAHLAPAEAPTGSAREPSAEPILARNPFDHATSFTALAARAAAPTAALAAIAATEPRDAPPCEGVRVVVIAASGDPEWSFAAFSAPDEPRPALHRRGDTLGARTVAFVGWDRVWLSDNGALCQASLFPEKEKDAAPSAKPIAAAPTVAGASPVSPQSPLAGVARGIHRLSPNDVEIDRATLDRILENQQDLMAHTRVVPDTIDGRVAGMRLLGIAPDSLLGLMGLANGDRIEAINGLELTSPERALEAYARVRNGDHFALRVTRGGQPMTIDYAIK